LGVLHVAFVMSQLMFCSLVFYLINNGQMEAVLNDAAVVEKIKTILVGTGAGVIVGGFSLFKRSMNTIHSRSLPITEKLERYRKAAIIRFAMIEFASLFFILFSFLTADVNNLVYAGVIILVLIVTRPSKSSIAKQLRVSEEELM
jgi:hypothetical protein